jgi:hypothetical protein
MKQYNSVWQTTIKTVIKYIKFQGNQYCSSRRQWRIWWSRGNLFTTSNSPFHLREIWPRSVHSPFPLLSDPPGQRGFRDLPAMVVCKCRKVILSPSADLAVPDRNPRGFMLITFAAADGFGIWGAWGWRIRRWRGLDRTIRRERRELWEGRTMGSSCWGSPCSVERIVGSSVCEHSVERILLLDAARRWRQC